MYRIYAWIHFSSFHGKVREWWLLSFNVISALYVFFLRHYWRETRKKSEDKSENCVVRVIQRADLCSHTFFLVKRVTQLPRHESLRLTLRVPRNFCPFFPLLNPSYRAHFQPLFLYGLSFTTNFLWSLSSRAPWKPRASWQKCTSAHTRPYSFFQKRGAKYLHLSVLAARLWQGKAQDWLCVAETTAFYRLGDQKEWMANASSLSESCMELRWHTDTEVSQEFKAGTIIRLGCDSTIMWCVREEVTITVIMMF